MQEAMSALRAQSFDVLFSDVGLPDACGTELSRKARALQPDLPVVFATGNEDVADANFNAATALLRKPYNSEDVAGVLAKVTKASRENG